MSPNFYVIASVTAILFVCGLGLGAGRWHQPVGKAIKVFLGLLLLFFLAFAGMVALLIWSSNNGHPM